MSKAAAIITLNLLTILSTENTLYFIVKQLYHKNPKLLQTGLAKVKQRLQNSPQGIYLIDMCLPI